MASKNLLHNPLLSLALCCMALIGPFSVVNAAERKELFFRTGITTGVFQGQDVTSGKFTTDVNLQSELWLYDSPQSAWTFRFLLADESKIGRARYFGAGIGQRFFFASDGILTDVKTGGDYFQIKPDWAYYLGWDVNLAQFLVVPVSPILSSYATIIDLGGTIGVKRIFTQKLSGDVMLGYAFGYSLASATTVTTNMIRMLFGFGYSF